MKLYVVTQEAIYRHKVMGIYETQAAAQIMLEAYIGQTTDPDRHYHDADGHHDYHVSVIESCAEITQDSDLECVAVYALEFRNRHQPTNYQWRQPR